jgi:predicted nucleotidyltransferase
MRVLFMYESGSVAYGIPAPEDVDLKVVYIVDPHDINLWRPAPRPKEVKQGKLDMVKVRIEHYLVQLWRPNINYAEWLFGEHLLADDYMVNELRKLASDPSYGIFTRNAIGHFRGMAKHTLYHANKEQWNRPKRILYTIRCYLQAIAFFEHRAILANMQQLMFKVLDSSFSTPDLVERLANLKKEGKSTDEDTIKDSQYAVEWLKERMEEAYIKTAAMPTWREKPTKEAHGKVNEYYTKLYYGDHNPMSLLWKRFENKDEI